jgi:hypothetical protein
VPASSPMLYSDAREALDRAAAYVVALQQQVNHARAMLETITRVTTSASCRLELQIDVGVRSPAWRTSQTRSLGPLTVVLGIVAWLIAVLFVLSWCRAAAIGDEAIARALRERRRHARRHG